MNSDNDNNEEQCKYITDVLRMIIIQCAMRN